MSEDQFQDWKDHSEFFFNHLKEKAESIPRAMEEIGRQLADCDPSDIPRIHKVATVLGSKAEILGQIINIEHEDIFIDD